MISKEKRIQDFVKLIKNLDISPTMFKNAKEKYENIGNFLSDKGLDIDVYPQGSFSLGTVVRPYRGDKEMDYDLDCICLVNYEKSNTSPKAVKQMVGDTLLSSQIYKERMQQEWDKCWTIQYAEINKVGFNIDVVPAVNEDGKTIERLQTKSDNASKIALSIAITNKIKDNEYRWCTNNPKGYKEWFDEINKPFKDYNRDVRKQMLFEENRAVYNSIEDIPEEIERSALQRAIQILKRHRDVYFSKIKKEDYKPISAIITTISAKIAELGDSSLEIVELLEYIANEFEIYSKQQNLSESDFKSKYINKKVIKREAGIWNIENPVNPEDNLADSWNNDPLKAKYFFMWVKEVKKDFIDSFNLDDAKFVSVLESSLGSEFVGKNIDVNFYCTEKPTTIYNTPKPWRI